MTCVSTGIRSSQETGRGARHSAGTTQCDLPRVSLSVLRHLLRRGRYTTPRSISEWVLLQECERRKAELDGEEAGHVVWGDPIDGVALGIRAGASNLHANAPIEVTVVLQNAGEFAVRCVEIHPVLDCRLTAR